MPLEIERVVNGDGSLLLALSGAIDDTIDLEPMLAELPSSVTIDLGGINRINSIGLKRWITAMERMTRRTKLTIDAVPYPMVLHANAVSDIFGRAEIRSCLAPYFCTKCQTCQTPIVTKSEVLGAGDTIPQKICVACNSIMAFDEIDAYFQFLKDA